jgi:hypothetical protein
LDGLDVSHKAVDGSHKIKNTTRRFHLVTVGCLYYKQLYRRNIKVILNHILHDQINHMEKVVLLMVYPACLSQILPKLNHGVLDLVKAVFNANLPGLDFAESGWAAWTGRSGGLAAWASGWAGLLGMVKNLKAG